MKIISGGQTGVDRAALDAALSLGVAGGGFCPAGRLGGGRHHPAEYPVEELPGGGYVERTARNVQRGRWDSYFSFRLAAGRDEGDGGFLRGNEEAVAAHRRRRDFPAGGGASNWKSSCGRTRSTILNVAGPRASQWPQGYDSRSRA